MKVILPFCDTCKFSVGIGQDKFECRRYPPSVNPDYRGKGFFPEVSPATWCGEYQRNKESDW